MSSLKKRGLYAHLLKAAEGGGPTPSNAEPSKAKKSKNPGYKIPLKQLKALRKKEDIVSTGQYERDSYVPPKTKGSHNL